MAFTGSFSKHLTPAFRDIVGLTFRNWQAFYSQYLNVESTSGPFEKYFAATGIPIAVEKPEGAPITFYDPMEGSEMIVRPDSYAVGVAVSRELFDDDLYKSKGAIHKAATALTKAFAELVEIKAAGILNGGFTDAAYNTVDGVVLFSTAHTRLDGGANQANRPAVEAALSLTSLRAGLLAFDKWVDDRGYKIRGNPRKLIIPLDLKYRAEELLKSQGKPGGNDNDPNVTRGAVDILVVPYLTSTTAWILQGSDHYLKFFWRTRPMLDSYDDKNTKVAKYTIWGRFGGPIPVHWFDMYGTTGV